MICKKCKRTIPDESAFCMFCGKSQTPPPKPRKKRENGTGTVYKRKANVSKPYVALTPCKSTPHGYRREVIGNYATAQEAKNALELYRLFPTQKLNMTLEQLHDEWVDIGYRNISVDLQNNYNAAWLKLRTLYSIKFRELRTAQMQKVIDYYSAPHQKEGLKGLLQTDKDGKPVMRGPLSGSSLSKIKILLGLMYDYALENDIVHKNYAKFLVLPEKAQSTKDRFSDLDLAIIEKSVDKVPFADCILMLCYTGHRISEFLSLNRFSVKYHNEIMLLHGGNKTKAGENKLVPVHEKVRPYFEKWIGKNGETIICRENGKPFTAKYFREQCYYPALDAMGLPRYTPHATRRTFATRLSASGVKEEDIIALMGHTDFSVDIQSYINQEASTLIRAVAKLS